MTANASAIVWIASYPKSGNTWVRAFLNQVLFDDRSDLLDLKRIPSFVGDERFRAFGDFSSADPGEIKKYWIEAQKSLCATTRGLSYFKTHNINASFGEYAFTSDEFTYGVIYLVRDPRDVLVSYARHAGLDLDEMRDRLLDKANYIRGADGYAEFISDWETHVRSWAAMRTRPRVLIRYEDLHAEPLKTFRRLADFAGVRLTDAALGDAAERVAFDSLRAREGARGFDEATEHTRFFRAGAVGQWRDLDYDRYVKPIEARFGATMKQLGYPLARDDRRR